MPEILKKEVISKSENSVLQTLSSPDIIISLSLDCPPKPNLELDEWNETRRIMSSVRDLVKKSEQRQKQDESPNYALDMGIGYTKMYAFQSETDPNLTAVVRVQPIPEEIRDFAYNTKGKTIAPERVRRRDVMLSLRYKLSDNSWAVCCMRFGASEDFSLLVGDPTTTDQLKEKKLQTDLEYFGVFKPQYLSFWIENQKPESKMKEVGLLIPSGDQILQAWQASAETSDFVGMLDNDMQYYLQQLDGGGVIPEIEDLARQTGSTEELRALSMSLIEKLKGAENYQIRAVPVNKDSLAGINSLLGKMKSKQLTTEDILPPGSLVDAQSEEWKAFNQNG